MLSRNTLLTMILLGGACIMRADPPSIDPTALAATQIVLNVQFGPTPLVTCPHPSNTGLCLAVTNFNVPNGKRLVIENISATASFNAHGGTDVLSESISMGVLLNGAVGFVTLPFDRSQVVGSTTYYYMNKHVRIYADPAVGFPELLIENLNSFGPIFATGSGAMSITLNGYLVNN